MCWGGRPAGEGRGPELPDKQRRDQGGGRLPFCHGRENDGKLPHQRCRSSDDNEGDL